MSEVPSEPLRCCRGTCRRAQPPMLMQGGLSSRWYVVLRYKDLGDGRFEAIEKHELHPDSARQMDELTDFGDPTENGSDRLSGSPDDPTGNPPSPEPAQEQP